MTLIHGLTAVATECRAFGAVALTPTLSQKGEGFKTPLPKSLEQLIFVRERESHEGMAPMHVQFLADVIAMSIDSAGTDGKVLGNFFAGFVIRQE